MSSSVYQDLMDTIANGRGWNEQEVAAFNSWKDKVAEIESNNIPDRVQKGGGPGRGKYQYEVKNNPNGAKGSGAAQQAINRLEALIGKDLPGVSEEEREELAKGADADFSKISEDVQDALFLADKIQHPDYPVNDLVKGKLSEADAWMDWHWKGKKKDRPSKEKMWRSRFPTQEDPNYNLMDYSIRRGDTLFSIANNLGVDVEDLRHFNEAIQNTDTIYPEQVIRVPDQRGARDLDVESLDAFEEYADELVPLGA